MFIEFNKKPKDIRLHLAKPNKQVISAISEQFNANLGVKYGSINELSFSIPHEIYEDGQIKTNPHIDMILERMLIRCTVNTYVEWFIVDSIEEDGDDEDTFNVICLSLGQELDGKRISGMEEIGVNAQTLLNKILEGTIWSVRSQDIDPIFNEMHRSFESGDDSNALECLIKAAETYGALIEWDTHNRRIAFKDATLDGSYKGFLIDYGKLIRSIKRTRTTEEMVTRLYIYGSEDLTIHSVNPTGMTYIEDFSYFMYPFERDANRNVLKSSYYMSDALCHALIDHQALVIENSQPVRDLNEDRVLKQTELVTRQSELTQLQGELDNILELLDVAKAAEDEAAITANNAARDAKEAEVSAKEDVIQGLMADINLIDAQLDMLQGEIADQANFTPDLLAELSLYIIENVWRDDNYIDAKELYEDGLKKFEEIRSPKIVIEADIENILNAVDEQYYWDKMVLGDLIKVRYGQMNIEYMAKIIEINYDFEQEEVSLVIANTKDLLSDSQKFMQLIYGNTSATSIIQANKYKWDKINAISQQVHQIIQNEWDATKNKIIAGVNNSIEIGKRGIIVRNPDFPDEVLIIQSGVMALSMDGGETWKTAIKPDGIVAERLIGRIIAGTELLITNSSGTFTMDNNGAIFDVDAFTIRSSSGNNLVEEWIEGKDFVDDFRDDNIITAYEKKMLKIEWDKIFLRYNANLEKVATYYANNGVGLAFVENYHTTYLALYDYLYTLPQDTLPLLHALNLSNSTRVDSAVFNNFFRSYENAEIELEKQLSLRGVEISLQAEAVANQALASIGSLDSFEIYINSSKGTVFKGGIINTVLTAKVIRNGTDITGTLASTAFVWEKYNKDDTLVAGWSRSGSTVSITSSDVTERATFSCKVTI